MFYHARWLPRLYMVKAFKLVFFRISKPISMIFGRLHYGPWPMIFCSHYYPGMTLTCFTARSKLATLAIIQEKATMIEIFCILWPANWLI